MTYEELYRQADEAGKLAVDALTPNPMLVKWDGGSELVSDGVCGFAWVNVKPGNSKFANWLKSKNYARPDSYEGGVCIWISDYNQSMQKKETYARAFSKFLVSNQVRSYSRSRMD